MNKKQQGILAANKRTKDIMDHLGVTIEARSTSASGAWLTIFGTQQHKGMPSWVVCNIRIVDNFVDFHRFVVQEAEAIDYESAKKETYDAAREFYEMVSEKLKEPHATIEDDPDSGMEVINPDGTKGKYTIN